MTTATLKRLTLALAATVAFAVPGDRVEAGGPSLHLGGNINKNFPIGKHNGRPLLNLNLDMPVAGIFNFGDNNRNGINQGSGQQGFGGDTTIWQQQRGPIYPSYPGGVSPSPYPIHPAPMYPNSMQSQNAGAHGNGNVIFGGARRIYRPIRYSHPVRY